MRLIKAVLGVCVVAVLAVSLGGCVVVPYGHGRGGYYHDHRGYR